MCHTALIPWMAEGGGGSCVVCSWGMEVLASVLVRKDQAARRRQTHLPLHPTLAFFSVSRVVLRTRK